MQMSNERIVSEFCKLTSIDSPSLGEREMGDYMKKCLRTLGIDSQEDDAAAKIGGNCGNLYAYLDGRKDTEPVLFCAHMDTVEPSIGKRAAIDENGVIHSLGNTVLGADDCSGIASILEALREISEQKLEHRSLEILFTVAEETYCKGSSVFDFSKLRSKEAYVLDLTGPVGAAALKAPSILTFTATILGKSAHAGFSPQDGIHAVKAMADALSKLQLGRINGQTTVNIGVIHGGLAENIIPASCSVSGEIRSYSHERALEAYADVQDCIESAATVYGAKTEYEMKVNCKAYEVQTDGPVIRRFERACDKLGIECMPGETFGGSDNNIFAENGINGIVLACAMNSCHSCEEYTSAAELKKISALVRTLMTDFT